MPIPTVLSPNEEFPSTESAQINSIRLRVSIYLQHNTTSYRNERPLKQDFSRGMWGEWRSDVFEGQ